MQFALTLATKTASWFTSMCKAICPELRQSSQRKILSPPKYHPFSPKSVKVKKQPTLARHVMKTLKHWFDFMGSLNKRTEFTMLCVMLCLKIWVRVCVCMCMCVCERERETEKERGEREREREREVFIKAVIIDLGPTFSLASGSLSCYSFFFRVVFKAQSDNFPSLFLLSCTISAWISPSLFTLRLSQLLSSF